MYRFFQRKERLVVPTLSMCGASSLSTKELERANDHVSRVICPGDGESAKLTLRKGKSRDRKVCGGRIARAC